MTVKQCLSVWDKLMVDGKEGQGTDGRDGQKRLLDAREEGWSGTGEGSDRSKTEGNRTESRKNTVGTIYILETEDRKLIKIGYTQKISMRLAQHAAFTRKTGGDVRLIGFFPGTMATEASLHRHFADCRFKSEWYHREPALERLAKLFDKPLFADLPVQLRDSAAVALGRKGGKARLKSMTPEERSEIARKAGQASAAARWGTKKEK